MKKIIILFVFLLVYFSALPQQQVNNFGSNPGNLNMYMYSPGSVPAGAPLILALHGCTQNASSYALESGWNSLADEYGFYVIYAEQKTANNSSQCFNWFESNDIRRGYGEAASLKSMVDYMKNNYSIDQSNVFVTGFSAGGAMTTVMMSTYPDVFTAGAVMSGLPYKVAIGSNEAFMAMFGNINKSPEQLGDLVRSGYPSYSGNWPRLATFHGDADYTVYFMNQRELMEQWTNVHNTDQIADQELNPFMNNPVVTRKDYQDANGRKAVTSYSIQGLRHAIAVDPGSEEYQGGKTGSYAVDANFFSSYWAADFFGILNSSTSPFGAPDNLNASAISADEILLSWNDNASIEVAYEVVRSSSQNGEFIYVTTLNPNSNTFNDTGLLPETKYYYRVAAIGPAGERAISSIVSGTTLPSDGGETVVTIEQPNGNGILSYNNNQSMGQSFTSTANGILQTISIHLVNSISNTVLRIYKGNTASGSAIFEQSGINKASGWQTINLQNGPSLLSGQQYTFQLDNASMKYSYSNVYAGGNFWYNSISYTVFDAAFKIEIKTTSATSSPNVEHLLAINPQRNLSPFLLYPNPANKSLHFLINSKNDNYNLKIISPQGIIISPSLSKNGDELTIELDGLPSGLYVVQITVEGKRYFKKIMIEKY